MEQLKYDQQSQKKSQTKKMSNLMDIYELIDISSSSEEEGEITRSSTPLPKDNGKYPRIVEEILNSSAEATADAEEFLDLSLNSLETECKRMKLSESYSSCETVKSGQYPQSESEEEIADSPESPDPSLNSDVFVVEKPCEEETSSMTSSKVVEFIRQATEDDACSYFESPRGPLRVWGEQKKETLNDLDEERGPAVMPPSRDQSVDPNVYELQYPFYQPRFPGRTIRPMTVALSQSAPGLGCDCLRVGFGRGHGCTARFEKTYFNY